MGRPAEKVVDGSVERALEVIDESTKELQKDIEDLTDFQDAVGELDVTGARSSGPAGVQLHNSQAKNDTDKVIELYEEHFFSEEEYPEEVDRYAEKFNISTVAADFFDEVTRALNVDGEDALARITYLDRGNPMAQQHVQEVVSLAEFPKALRRSVKDDVGVEADSLNHYRNKIRDIEEDLLELNREYTLPMDIDEAREVVESLEQLEERVQSVKDQREHELRRRPDILDNYFERNLEKFYEDENFENPVVRDLNRLQKGIDEAYDNIVV